MRQVFPRNPQRKKNRLSEYDYSQNGYYFITICTKNKGEYFGKINNGKILLSEIGNLTKKHWNEISQHFPFIELDEYVIMPNHIHGIIIIDNENNVGNNYSCSLQNRNMELLPKIISQFKSSVTRQIRKQFNNYDFAWQKSFFDHIIRTEKSLFNIRNYIFYNPSKWDLEKNDIENLEM
ncbi:MAG: transposase [Bacteroidota bacterium]